ncbi:5-formyltetrahydrofolate cyclo-ligase [Martelella soudanensis]|uniref:5-formyltetrahydrofolate cyclo-ligase n=1 Tax=unclassified Martelella TaxID=2629616 RepID=UPI0015DDF27C|nr:MULTISPECIES: 5-formyltetrahydrofolate cyclo-ligase [unclassified Martelella]
MLSKPELRRQILAKRDALSPEERHTKSLAIAAHGASALAPLAPRRWFAAYHPIRSEADVSLLAKLLEQAGARLALPAVIDRETIAFRAYLSDVPLVSCGFGTMAPGEDADIVIPDILLMPLSVFDSKGNRIGYGAGHYDRAIARMAAAGRRPLLVAVAFALQEAPAVPAEPHDIPLDAVITEAGFRWFE